MTVARGHPTINNSGGRKRAALPMQTRLAPVASIDAAERNFDPPEQQSAKTQRNLE
ncbi:MAG: hypothetical protein ACKO1N_06760 [Erythrobacter sp.]